MTERIVDSDIGDVEIREFVTVHDSSIGDGSLILERVSVKKSSLGENVDVNAGTYIENAVIGDKVQIGPNCSIVGVTHPLGEDGMEYRDDVFKQISVGDGSFIGAGATVLPGIELGEDCVVAANSTVTEDVPEKHIWKGTPPNHSLESLQ